MTTLSELQTLFPAAIPTRPEAHYAHIVTLRVTESYPIFRTDGDLNTARVAAGRSRDHDAVGSRVHGSTDRSDHWPFAKDNHRHSRPLSGANSRSSGPSNLQF